MTTTAPTVLEQLTCAADALRELARLLAMDEEPEAGQFLAIARDAVLDATDEAAYDAANFAHAVASWDLDNAHTAIERAESDVEECAGDAGELAEVRDIADEAYRVARAAYNATDATLTPLRTAREEYRAALAAQRAE